MGAKLNLAAIPPPDIVTSLDYDANLLRILEKLKAAIPGWKGAPSDPLRKAAEVFAYEQFLIQARTNESIKQMLIAYSKGSNLDNLGALLGIIRTKIELDDGSVIVESDNSFRESIISAPDGSSTAGTESSYEFHIRRICSRIDSDPKSETPIKLADVNAFSPEKEEGGRTGRISIVILFSDQPSGKVTADVAEKRFETLKKEMLKEDIIPLSDRISFEMAELTKVELNATLFLRKGPDPGPFANSALDRATALFEENFRVGREIGISSIFSALHVSGVTKVEIKREGEPFSSNLTPKQNEAIYAQIKGIGTDDSAR